MNDKNQKLVNSIINDFSTKLKPLIQDFVIKDNKAFVTLKAKDYKDAVNLQIYKKECEDVLKNKKIFEEIFVSFVEKEQKFKKVIAVSSCKGGVGKSTVAVNLALALSKLDYSVGLLDADIYGPSIPNLLNINEKPEVDNEKKIIPAQKKNLKIMSIGLLIEEDKPVVWRGPMIQSALTQLIEEVKWGKLDFLVVDLPPGTGDAYLAILQKLNIDHSIIVTTSQKLALSDTKKGINLMLKFNIPITGIVENMSFFQCENCLKANYIFGKNGAEDLAKEFNTKVIAKLPIFVETNNILNNSAQEKLKEEIFSDLAKQLEN